MYSVNVEDYPVFKHLKDVVVFSQHGQHPLPHKLAGGDLDGDTFFVNIFLSLINICIWDMLGEATAHQWKLHLSRLW